MDSPHSEAFESLAKLRDALPLGDWGTAERIARTIRQHKLPATPEGLRAYLEELTETLIAAKVWRANSKASLVRLNAAARFQASGAETLAGRQKSAVSTEF